MHPPSAPRRRDALERLRLDHERIRKLLRQYDALRLVQGCHAECKAEIVEQLCDALSLNALIEEEVFYPLVRPVLEAAVPVKTLLCDHARLRSLIAHLDEMEPGDPGYDDAVVDLGECVLPSLDDARSVLFVQVRMTGLDTVALGEQMTRWRRVQRQDLTRIAWRGRSSPSSREAGLSAASQRTCR